MTLTGPEIDSKPANVRPFLRWAGSKRKLLKHLQPFIPPQWNRYYEPFLGGGAMFLYLGPRSAEISDASPALINTYKVAKKNAAEILEYLRPLKPTKETFDRIKRSGEHGPLCQAASFIFLNKACWNGLYRVNKAGIFNVPFGWPKTDFIIDEENFLRCASLLRQRSVSIRCQDFSAIEPRVKGGDFVFFDPPYVTAHNMNGFVDWNESIFSWQDQNRLAALAQSLVERGANVLITNANHPSIHRLYKNFRSKKFNRTTTLAGDVSKRGSTSEAIFFGGPYYDSLKTPRRRIEGIGHGCKY